MGRLLLLLLHREVPCFAVCLILLLLMLLLLTLLIRRFNDLKSIDKLASVQVRACCAVVASWLGNI